MAFAIWNRTIQDDKGNVQGGASVEVRDANTNALATLYSDRDGTTLKTNPFLTNDDGHASFFVIGGAYNVTAKKGAFQMTFQYEAVGTAAEYDFTSIVDGFSPGIYNSRTDVMSSIVPTTLNAIRINGYYNAGDGGDALYKRVASEPTHAGKIQSADGAWWEIASNQVNVKQFGAKADGVTDDASAFNAALAFSGDVFIPRGIYMISSGVSVTGKPVRLRGAGVGITIIKCSMTTGTMLGINPTSGDHFFDVGDFSCISTATVSTTTSAIIIDGTSQLTAATYRGMFMTGMREKRRGTINNIDFLPNGAIGCFGYGVRIKCLLNFKMSDMTFTGASSAFAKEAFAIEGHGVPVDIRAHNLYAYNCGFGLRMPDYVEALYLRDVEFVNVNVGIENKFVSGRSVVESSLTARSNSMKLGPLHVSAKSDVAIDMQGADYMVLRDTLIIMQNEIKPQKVCVNINGGNMVKISGNQFVGMLGTTSNANAMFAVVGNRLTNSQLCDNTVNGLNEVFHLGSASVSNIISGNINMSGGVGRIVVTNDSASVANIIKDNRNDSTDLYVLASMNNTIGTTTYARRMVITLPAVAAGGYTDYAFTAPTYLIKAIPTMAKLESENGDNNLVGILLYSSTATTWNFRIFNRAKAAIGAGSYNVAIHAMVMTG